MAFMRIPEFDVPGLTRFLADMDERLLSDRESKLSKVTANYSLLLLSPAGKVYEVKVNDAGALTTTLVSNTPL